MKLERLLNFKELQHHNSNQNITDICLDSRLVNNGNLFFLLEVIIGPIWVWLIINEKPSIETIIGGFVILITIATHSYAALKKTQIKSN